MEKPSGSFQKEPTHRFLRGRNRPKNRQTAWLAAPYVTILVKMIDCPRNRSPIEEFLPQYEKSMKSPLFILAGIAALTAASHGAMAITEYMYNSVTAGGVGEFVEFTNVGSTVIDMTGYSFDDSSGVAGSFSLSSFGLVAPGESVILTDATVPAFNTNWGLTGSVKVIGGNDQNLGRSDGLNLFDASNTLVDTLTYNDQATPPGSGGIRTSGVSAYAGSPSVYFSHNPALFTGSVTGVNGAYTAVSGDIGSPGINTAVPEASSLAIAGLAALGFLRRRRA
jgi:hypothetical protein